MATETIAHRILQQANQRPEAPAYYKKQSGQWKMTTWKGYADEIRNVGKALIALGMKPGDTVCILGFNAPEWTIMDVAALSVGGVPAGIYTTCSPSEVGYILSHAESSIVLIEDALQWDKILAIRGECPALKHVVTFQKTRINDPGVLSWDAFIALGSDVDDTEFDRRMASLEDDQLATLIYTSGTTGPPKGVMLSHRNLAWTAEVAQSVTSACGTDSSLSYLPLSHIAEQMFTIHIPATIGSAVWYAESIERVPENLKEVQPTIFFGVPRIWEKFYAGISGKLGEMTGVRAQVVAFARKVGSEVSALKARGEPVPTALGLQYKLSHRLIFSQLKQAIGLNKARICVSGAAPVSAEVLQFLASLDVFVMEVYGQSEGSGPTTFNLANKTLFGSVGVPLPGVEVVIAPDDEVMVRGGNVFLGYYKDQEATDECLQDGWLASGDLGKFDADGFLHIIGRKKDIIITAGGKNITPKNIEEALKNIEAVNEAVLIGDRRKYCVALVTLDPEWSARFAASRGLNPASLHQDEAVLKLVQDGVDQVNATLARVEQIKRFAIVPRNFSVEEGELTPTLKIKRRTVNTNWNDLIESLYDE